MIVSQALLLGETAGAGVFALIVKAFPKEGARKQGAGRLLRIGDWVRDGENIEPTNYVGGSMEY